MVRDLSIVDFGQIVAACAAVALSLVFVPHNVRAEQTGACTSSEVAVIYDDASELDVACRAVDDVVAYFREIGFDFSTRVSLRFVNQSGVRSSGHSPAHGLFDPLQSRIVIYRKSDPKPWNQAWSLQLSPRVSRAASAEQGVGDGPVQVVEAAGGGLLEKGLELGEGHLDRIEVGGVRRQEARLGPSAANGAPDRRRLVRRQIVHDDDVAGLQGGGQLLDTGREGAAIHRSVEQHGRRQAIEPQAAHNVVVFQWPCATPPCNGCRTANGRRDGLFFGSPLFHVGSLRSSFPAMR